MVGGLGVPHPWWMARKPYKKLREKHPGHYLRDWREAKGLSQERVAERVGMSVPQVSKIENGKQGYRQETLEQFAKALGCGPADLLRPPHAPENELALYIMALSEKRRQRALKALKAIFEGEDESPAQPKVA